MDNGWATEHLLFRSAQWEGVFPAGFWGCLETVSEQAWSSVRRWRVLEREKGP